MITYSFKLYSSKRNNKLHSKINISCCIYNHCIALHKRYYRIYGKSINSYKLKIHITKLKKLKRYKFWNQVNSQAIQDIAERIDKSYKLFFRKQRKNIKSSPPSFKKIRIYKSFTLKQVGYKLGADNNITICKCDFKYFKSRDIEGKIKTVTIKRDTLGDIYIYLTCEKEKTEVINRSSKTVGYDFGLKRFLTASDGNNIESPLFFKMNAAKIKKASRNLSSRKGGSNNRKRARLNLARIYKKVENCRKDFHFKTARNICNKYSAVYIEDLDIQAMQRLWGRKISDLGHSQFINILNHQAEKLGTSIVKIPRFYPSSKTCSCCGFLKENLSLKDRTYNCNNCGLEIDRDVNASINISRVGTSTLLGEIQ